MWGSILINEKFISFNRANNIDWNMETDVIIIGSGFAGLSAAIEARNTGAAVIVLEKMKLVGGNSIISDGGIAAPNTSIQKKYEIKDSVELMYSDMMKAGLGISNPELVRIVSENAEDSF